MKYRLVFILALAGKFFTVNSSAQFADAVVAYSPGTGVSAGYTNPASALGEASRVTPGTFGGPVTPFASPYLGSQLVSVGAGGALTLRLDTPLHHDRTHPFGLDFSIFGNAFFVTTNNAGDITGGDVFGNAPGNTRVSVSVDGANFFTLNPALAPTVDSYYPTDGSGDFFLPVNPSLNGANFGGLELAGIRTLYAGSGGGAGYSLDWAQDTNGQPVTVAGVKFIRIEVLNGKSEVDAVAAVAPVGGGVVWWENFATNPPSRNWSVFGDTNLFQWNSNDGHLEVTWDSSRSNSFFQLPLGTLLTRRDNFSVALDLELQDINYGTTPGKPGTFQIAFGFINSANAHATNFIRGTGQDSPNLVEFNFFPDSGWGPTVWPAVFDANGAFNYNNSSDFSLFELPVGIPMRFVLGYTASNQSVAVSITTNGVLVGPVTTAPLAPSFTQFFLDSFAISSYSDAGQDPYYAGSVLAHGIVDNIVISAQPPLIRNFAGQLAPNGWQGSFLSRTNWNYALQATTDFVTWSNAAPSTPGNGQTMNLTDTNAASFNQRFYRITAEPSF